MVDAVVAASKNMRSMAEEPYLEPLTIMTVQQFGLRSP